MRVIWEITSERNSSWYSCVTIWKLPRSFCHTGGLLHPHRMTEEPAPHPYLIAPSETGPGLAWHQPTAQVRQIKAREELW